MNQGELYEGDSTIRRGEDGNWYHYPTLFIPKLLFLFFSIAMTAVGTLLIWDPAVRGIFGEKGVARLIEIRREEPGQEDEIIRYRKNVEEGSHLSRFYYTIALETKEGGVQHMDLAVASIRNPYAKVNDSIDVIYFKGEKHAYALYHLRTWAFGVGFLFVGVILLACAVPTLLAVGKPILIDKEAPQEAEAAAT